MSTVSGISYGDYITYGGITGNATQIDAGLQIAWDMMEEHLHTYLRSTQVTDEMHKWPNNGIIGLDMFRLTSVDQVTARHDRADCNCNIEDFTGCSIIVDKKTSIITVRDCNSSCSTCGTSSSPVPLIVLVDYTSGFATLPLPLKKAIIMLASEEVAQMVGEKEMGAPAVVQWKSLSYSETRAKLSKTPFGTSYAAMAAANYARAYKVTRAVAPSRPRTAMGL